MLHHPETHKLGRKRGIVTHPNDLPMAAFVDKAVAFPEIPSTVHNTKHATFEMYGNDRAGDCTFAGIGNLTRCATRDRVKISEQAVIAGYSDLTGYNPQTGANDNGAYEPDVLEYWRTKGVEGHKILAHATVAIDPDWFRLAAYLFGGVYIGVDLAVAQQHQKIWKAPANLSGDNAPGSWGGHAVPVEDITTTGGTLVTWGAKKRFTWDFIKDFCTEAHAVILPEWMANPRPGVNAAALAEYLRGLKH